MHVTQQLKKIKNKSYFFHGVNYGKEWSARGFDFKANPYPKWVKGKSEYALFGKFVDYVMRKMIISRYGDIVQYELPQSFHSIEKIVKQDLNPYDKSYIKNCTEYLKRFMDKGVKWQDTIAECYHLAYIDEYHDESVPFHIPVNVPSQEDFAQSMPYFIEIEKLIKKTFSKAKEIYLNPNLSHKFTMGGEADIIAKFEDQAKIYDIKTTWNPVQTCKDAYWQLLAYTAMHEYLRFYGRVKDDAEKGIRGTPVKKVGRVTHVAVILPNQSKIIQKNVTYWSKQKRLAYIYKLKSAK